MEFAAGPRAAQAGYRVASHDSLDSTNSEGLRRARDGERGPLWIVARAQSAGRGRRGREWVTLAGNLAASLLVTGAMTPPAAANLGFVAGLALCQALDESAPGLTVALKWPNDVLADGKKLAGILLESEAVGADLAVVVGFGVNLAAAPEQTPFPAVSLAALGHPVGAEALFARLTDAWMRYERLWDGGRGFGEVRTLWLQRAQGLHAPVSVRMGERVEHGIFETLDGEGRLILRRADGSAFPISAGDVFFGDTASAPGASC